MKFEILLYKKIYQCTYIIIKQPAKFSNVARSKKTDVVVEA